MWRHTGIGGGGGGLWQVIIFLPISDCYDFQNVATRTFPSDTKFTRTFVYYEGMETVPFLAIGRILQHSWHLMLRHLSYIDIGITPRA